MIVYGGIAIFILLNSFRVLVPWDSFYLTMKGVVSEVYSKCLVVVRMCSKTRVGFAYMTSKMFLHRDERQGGYAHLWLLNR